MRKSSKRKVRPVISDVLNYILSGNLPLTAAATTMTRVKVANHSAMDSLVRGKGTPQDVLTLDHMLITAKALAVAVDVGLDWLPELTAAHDALYAINDRGGRPVLRASEINALNLAIEIHDAQLQNCTVKELEDAINAAKQALRYGHAVKEKV